MGVAAVAATLAARMMLSREPLAAALGSLGLARPAGRGVAAALAVSGVMLLYFPGYSLAGGAPLRLREGWLALAPGLFAQAGIAEEVLFRGYLYGELRRTRPFWRAATLSLPPFVAVHLLLFATLDPAIAGAALLVSVVLSFPLARLYDLGGGTIWAPALLHWVVQGAIKVVEAPVAGRIHRSPPSFHHSAIAHGLT